MTCFQSLLALKLVLFTTAQMSTLQSSENQQEKGSFLSATVGENITLPCVFVEQVKTGARLYWYRQKSSMKPALMASYFKYDQENQFYGKFRDRKRFSVDFDDDRYDLHIRNVSASDSAVYHCVRCFLHQSEFVESVTVIVKTSKPTVEVQQSPNEDVEPGQSVVVNCSVQTWSCVGPLRVHWFKQSEESAAGVLYSDGGSSDQCERKTTDTQTDSCVYNLPIRNVSSEQTGTYYCAVAACGQVLFGDGTRVKIKDGASVSAVYILSGVSVFSTSLVFGLTVLLCTQNNNEKCTRYSTAKTKENPKLLQYKATEQVNRRSPAEDTWSECIYFSVKQST
ncbi:hypothetical protein WMY93_017273 [Mugilogobius chulae]|uniref:Ig-like domain-containing protein n=1 Tax=Mugilogobius chulae TaxID=88201 RepID=A0AAW0NN76_9GOBI